MICQAPVMVMMASMGYLLDSLQVRALAVKQGRSLQESSEAACRKAEKGACHKAGQQLAGKGGGQLAGTLKVSLQGGSIES